MRKTILLACVLVASPAWADIVRLKDGSSINGEIRKTADGWYVTDPKGKTHFVSAASVQSIELAPRGDPKDVATGRLMSLQRSVEALGDLNVIVDRYEKFIEQYKGQPVAAEAVRDLATWKERQEKGMVKAGGKWVTADERAAMQEKALAVADHARELLKQNKFRDAEAAVTKALQDDPTNVSALYLRGLILYRQDQIPQARKAFEAVKEVEPDHGPTLNNLAVIMWRQNQQIAALNVYLQAMQAMPLNKEILNNVAEALDALTDDQKKGQVPQKVLKTWTAQDVQLQQQLMPLGWYRWGATWVDRATFDKVQAAEKEAKEKIAKLEADFTDAQAKIDTIDLSVRQNREIMRDMERQRFATDFNTGRQMIFPLPPQYYDYERANRRLEIQRQEVLTLIEALRTKARLIKDQLPVPRYTGAQLAIGVEGTPAIPVASVPAVPADPKPADPRPADAKPVEIIPAGPPSPGNDAPAPTLPTEPAAKPFERPLRY